MFDDSASGTITINAGDVNPGSVTFENTTASYTLEGTNGIAGSTGLSKSGGGSLTIANTNSFTGGSTLDGGTVTLNAASALGTGPITLAAGTLDIGVANALGTGTLTITGGAIDNSSGAALTLSTNNPQNWNGDFTFVGSKDLNLGTGAVTLGASRTVTVTAGNLTVGGIISGSGFALTKAGSGTLTLANANAYTGGTNINAGLLRAANSGAFGSSGAIGFGGGTLQYSGITTDFSPRFSIAANQAYKIDTNSQSVTFATGLTSSGGSLTKSGAGTLTLTAVSTYNGPTVVNGGTLQLNTTNGGGGQLSGTPSITVNSGGVLALNAADVIGYTNGDEALVVNSGGIISNITAAARVTIQNVVTMTGGTLTGTGAGDANGQYSFNNGAAGILATSDAAGNPATISAKISPQAGDLNIDVTRGSANPVSDLNITASIIPFAGNATGHHQERQRHLDALGEQHLRRRHHDQRRHVADRQQLQRGRHARRRQGDRQRESGLQS